MPDILTPEPITPLGQDVTDLQVINDTAEQPQLPCDTEEAKILQTIVQDYDREEEFVRLRLVKKLRKNLHYWNNYQYLAWDEMSHDWMTPDQVVEQDPQADIDPAIYAKVINVYKAHGDILIGALTSGTPSVRFMPKDADDQEDVTSAKAHSKLAEVVQKQNHAKLLLMKSLFILYNQNFVAAYNENKSDYRFGSIKVPDYEDVDVVDRQGYCPSCGQQLAQDQIPAPPGSMTPPGAMPPGPPGAPPPEPGPEPGPEPAPEPAPEPPLDDMGEQPPEMPPGPLGPPPPPQLPPMPDQNCPNCGPVTPETEDTPNSIQQQTGEHEEPKNRECIEVYGPLNVKVPVWVRDQFSAPYLILETEEHVSLMKEIYPEIADKIQATSYPDLYDKEARVPTHYRTDFPRNLVTVQRVWLRPWAFNSYAKDDDMVAKLKTTYKKGCYVVLINKDLVAEMMEDGLDDHWTISENPLSEVLHSEPIGAPMIPLQDITNELANLTLETIEFGIPEIFADGRVLDFDSYPRNEARPGQVSQATAPSGMNLASGFHEIKASTLSREVEAFADRVFNTAQFVMGSYPSIYGGSIEGGSGTAKEYEMSKASALQRMSTTWYVLQEWWTKVIAKSVKSFVKNMREDERMVQSKGSNFINVWIRKSDLSGEVGDIDPEITETFPISWTQKRDVLLNLIQMQNEDIAAVIRHPENAGLIASIIGVPELFVPGDDSRNKQLYEIAVLIRAQPSLGPSTPGNPMGIISSVPIDQDVDDHEVEAEVCKAWLRSEVGLDAKETNPAGYANVLAHLKEHLAISTQQQLDTADVQAQAAGAGDQMTGQGVGA